MMKSAEKRAQLSALIVDDEPFARASLRTLLEREPDAITIFEARNGHEAASLILGERPDVVFLDVQMPEMNGFDVVRQVGAAAMPDVVFVTAHDQFAIQAFEINALDYLLKPVSEERFAEALQRTRSHLRRRGDASERIVSLLQTLAVAAENPHAHRRAFRRQDEIRGSGGCALDSSSRELCATAYRHFPAPGACNHSIHA